MVQHGHGVGPPAKKESAETITDRMVRTASEGIIRTFLLISLYLSYPLYNTTDRAIEKEDCLHTDFMTLSKVSSLVRSPE